MNLNLLVGGGGVGREIIPAERRVAKIEKHDIAGHQTEQAARIAGERGEALIPASGWGEVKGPWIATQTTNGIKPRRPLASALARGARSHREPHSVIPSSSGYGNTPSAMRTWVAIAPPKYPVRRIAPSTCVRRTRYRSVHAISTQAIAVTSPRRQPSSAKCSGTPPVFRPSSPR